MLSSVEYIITNVSKNMNVSVSSTVITNMKVNEMVGHSLKMEEIDIDDF